MATEFKCFIYIGENPAYFTGKFTVVDITTPTLPKQIGWFFQIPEVTANQLEGAMIQPNINQHEFFFPYRQITSNFQFTNPIGSGKYIEFNIEVQDKVYKKVKVLFEYGVFTSVISDPELTSLITNLNQLKSNKKQQVEKIKKDIQAAANTYVTNYHNLEAQKLGTAKVQELIGKNNAQIAQLQQLQTSDTTTSNTLQTQIAEQEKVLANIKKQLDDLNGSLNSRASLIYESTASLSRLNNQKATGLSSSATADASLAQRKTEFENSMNYLKRLVGTDENKVENAKNQLITDATQLAQCTATIESLFV